MKKITEVLKSGIFDLERTRTERLVSRFESGGRFRLVYGETYDVYGGTIDSLKYYLVMEILHRLLDECGCEAHSQIIVGDTASVRNKNTKGVRDEILSMARKQKQFILNLKEKFKLKIEPVPMSKLFEDKEFKLRLNSVKAIVNESEEIMNVLKKTVMENRLKQEKEEGFRYACEEIALILAYDIKIGPPREQFYDQAANMVSEKMGGGNLDGIYLKPTYPLGQGFDYFINNPEIEKYGLTPYKAGSNRMQDSRIILGKTRFEKVKDMLDNTFIPDSKDLPNPMLDLYITSDLYRRIVENDFDFKGTYVQKEVTTEKVANLLKPILK